MNRENNGNSCKCLHYLRNSLKYVHDKNMARKIFQLIQTIQITSRYICIFLQFFNKTGVGIFYFDKAKVPKSFISIVVVDCLESWFAAYSRKNFTVKEVDRTLR
jgi:hypothetical protein